jgi:hypothetical protein
MHGRQLYKKKMIVNYLSEHIILLAFPENQFGTQSLFIHLLQCNTATRFGAVEGVQDPAKTLLKK